ncbi:MAG TPA: dioxygenase [Solirubrobacterales bacterium]|jgi:protocatechuate 3,4-dioxygenase beta subunit
MTESDRLREVTFRSAEVLCDVVREMDVTQDELHAAAGFLNRLGEAGVFPSMLDIGFAMTVIDREREGALGTRPNLEGPEYRPGAPERPGGSLLEQEPGAGAQMLTLTGTVTDVATGEPIEGVELDFWHADEHGGYDRDGWHLRGVVRTGEGGTYTARTLLPKDYAEHEGDPIGELLEMMGRDRYRAAHIHLKVRVGGEEWLTTQVFRGDSPYLETDYVIGAVSDDLVLDLQQSGSGEGREEFDAVFDLALEAPAGAGR